MLSTVAATVWCWLPCCYPISRGLILQYGTSDCRMTVADRYQMEFDEPLLTAMYVDRQPIALQTLRLDHPPQHLQELAGQSEWTGHAGTVTRSPST